MSFGEKITALRKKKGITQEQLAEMLGVTRQTISKWELDQSTPDLNYISRLSELYEVTTDYLIKEKGEKTEAEDIYSEIVGQNYDQTKQIIYVNNSLSATCIAGIVICIIGVALMLVGLIQLSESGDWMLGIILGIFGVIVGVEMILVKKHPVLVALWTVWTTVFIFLFVFMVNMPLGAGNPFAFGTMAGIVNWVHVVYFIGLVIGTVVTLRKKKEK